MKHVRRALTVGLAAVLLAGAAGPALAAPPGLAEVQRNLDLLTTVDGVPGALAHVRDRGGRERTLTSGTAETGTGRPMTGAADTFRIASVTKPFIAVTLLQSRVDLDAPVERYLPGVVRGRGAGAEIDGRRITVRQVLQHTSGIPEYNRSFDWSKPFPEEPTGYLDVALVRTPTGKPGERWAYSNTNYLIAGMIVNRLAGKDFREVTEERILRPLGMTGTYWPTKKEYGLRGRHAHHYGVHPANPAAGVVDVTSFPGYEFGASGGLVSTPADLDVFWRGLYSGKLLPPHVVRSMTADLRPAAGQNFSYGIGIGSIKLSCGGSVFAHSGDVPGVTAYSGRDRSGRTVTVFITTNSNTPERDKHLADAFDAAFCARRL
ncbi:beta-lactamase family protein [Allokutzneria sp. A3M-2-11 16]|uniref:serine hydrolase domain-containing protein n=1 Tax=Allokutzneria sp. A3M-2-11 16 TaxID=2962043 RepID=UPI0020B799A0|nr:serine hydrolase domain-containing protein [Allokutzneria sp. A3M-2-11 16]MCP3802072.1 beta-lactamase family protein [Allokutzneria sp. A3M-2-11 16]